VIQVAKKIRQQFADTMLEVGKADEKLVVLIGDISHFILQDFAKACPGRFYNIGICEPTIVSMGAGLAKAGLYPVMHTIAPFLIERSFEQLKLDFSYHRLAGNLITVGGAFDYAKLGCTHHCYDDWGLLKSLQNTEVLHPASPLEFDILFKQTYRNDRLTLHRLAEHGHGHEFNPEQIKFGKGIKVTDGDGLTIVATGSHLRDALECRTDLSAMGLSPEILYIHTIHPLDLDLICASALKTRRVLVIEEHVRPGGVGDAVLGAIHGLGDIEFQWLGIGNTFIHEYRSYAGHCDALGLNSRGILKIAKEFK
jgi:transketolase